MEQRLTKRDEFDSASIDIDYFEDVVLGLNFKDLNTITAALNKLAAYEDTELSPEEIKEMKYRIESLEK